MAHSWLGKLVFVNLRLEPVLLFRVEDENIVNYSLLAVTLSSSKHQQELAELG